MVLNLYSSANILIVFMVPEGIESIQGCIFKSQVSTSWKLGYSKYQSSVGETNEKDLALRSDCNLC